MIDWDKYDGIELASCMYAGKDGFAVECIEDEQFAADVVMYCLYLHCKAGGIESVADFPANEMGLHLCHELAGLLIALRQGLREHGINDYIIERKEATT